MTDYDDFNQAMALEWEQRDRDRWEHERAIAESMADLERES